jgi:hypothetical protein
VEILTRIKAQLSSKDPWIFVPIAELSAVKTYKKSTQIQTYHQVRIGNESEVFLIRYSERCRADYGDKKT